MFDLVYCLMLAFCLVCLCVWLLVGLVCGAVSIIVLFCSVFCLLIATQVWSGVPPFGISGPAIHTKTSINALDL